MTDEMVVLTDETKQPSEKLRVATKDEQKSRIERRNFKSFRSHIEHSKLRFIF